MDRHKLLDLYKQWPEYPLGYVPLEHAIQWLGELYWRYVESTWLMGNLMENTLWLSIDSIENFLKEFSVTE